MWPCIVTNFRIIKPTRCTNFSNLFWNETLHVPYQNKFEKSVHLIGFIVREQGHLQLPRGKPVAHRWTSEAYTRRSMSIPGSVTETFFHRVNPRTYKNVYWTDSVHLALIAMHLLLHYCEEYTYIGLRCKKYKLKHFSCLEKDIWNFSQHFKISELVSSYSTIYWGTPKDVLRSPGWKTADLGDGCSSDKVLLG
jgi:hypothetical protein